METTRVCFFCGCLEPGKDGVGDYTRRLAGELIRQGQDAFIVSLNDRQLDGMFWEGEQKDGDEAIPVLRMSNELSWRRRLERSKLFLRDLRPTWLSLQFVPFSFHDRGLAVNLSSFIKALKKSTKLHLMFHELWVGMAQNASVKYRIWGFMQRKLIENLIDTLDPELITTQVELYKQYLQAIGSKADLLPLFGNIPVVNKRRLIRDGQIVVFGNIHPSTPIQSFAEKLNEIQRKRANSFKVIFVGRNGLQRDLWKSTFENFGIAVEALGEMSSESVSKCFLESMWGVSTTPRLLSEKSGAYAAMREHGLPVIHVAESWNARPLGRFKPHEAPDNNFDDIEAYNYLPVRSINTDRLSEVAELLIHKLTTTKWQA